MRRVTTTTTTTTSQEDICRGINFDDSFDLTSQPATTKNTPCEYLSSDFEWDESDSVVLAAAAANTIGTTINSCIEIKSVSPESEDEIKISPKLSPKTENITLTPKTERVTPKIERVSSKTETYINTTPGRNLELSYSSPIMPGKQRVQIPSSYPSLLTVDSKRQHSQEESTLVHTRKYSAIAVPLPEENLEKYRSVQELLSEDEANINEVLYKRSDSNSPKRKQSKPSSPTVTYTKTKTKPSNNHTIQLATQKGGEPSTTKVVKPIILSQEQEHILQKVMQGKSLFYTGSAGTGKSILLRSIIKNLHSKHPKRIAITASTGLAACNIGGTTLHRFAGFGLGEGTVESLIKKIKKTRGTVERWRSVKVLVIDEISMIDGKLLNNLNAIAKDLRRNNAPFGGIQLVVCGDFHQLPPVVKRVTRDGETLKEVPDTFFAFESEAWQETIEETFILQEIFRQKGDQTFIDMLNEMRYGNITPDTITKFRELSRPFECPDWIEPTQLYATRYEVDNANQSRLNKLPGEKIEYFAQDGGILPEGGPRQNLLDNFLAPSVLPLKKDSQVICIKNFDDTLVNGSLGQVIDFVDKQTYLNNTDLEDDYIFSGIKDGSILFSSKLQKEEANNTKRKKELAEKFSEDTRPDLKPCPVVRFLLPDGVNTRTVVMEPERWTVEDDKEQVLVYRDQIPLLLAWSLSIHKSQGQTLQMVKVDLKKVFEHGQAYVALSRAVSRSGLQVLNFNPSKVKSHPKVARFYHELKQGQQKIGQSKLEFPSFPTNELKFDLANG
ncbi:ATP-dependent DNA helicase PIF1 [Spathaspora sp. JA1]|nr:ATP-dependent DNA helicase PIF1 [Spathaspora sp. JA1]